MTSSDRLADVLGVAVRVRDLRIGTVTGVVGDTGFERVIGLEVMSPDGGRRFLPMVAATFEKGGVQMRSSLVLVETGDVAGYGRLGAVVARDPVRLAQLVMEQDGRVLAAEDRRGVSLNGASGISAV